jgi:CubicO group peptidase (beta-lactamase class C family)
MMRQRTFRFLTLAVSLLSISQIVFGQQTPLNGFDDYVNKAISDWKVPGVAIAIIKDDKIVYAKGYGVRKLGEPTPVDERTLFAIGSSSKAFTSAAVAMLVDEGKVKWDDPVIKHLQGFEMFDPYVTRELKIRDLLSHRSGLERGDFLWYGSDLDRDEILRHVRYLKPTWSLRSNFGYQNLMYLAAGQVASKVTSKSWDELIKTRIFTPLGMTASSTSIRDFKNGDNVATPHASIDDKVQPIAWRNIDNIGPAGSINSNVIDMAQWVRMQLGNGTFEGKKLISPGAIKEMQMPQTVMRLEGAYSLFYPEAHFLNYGLGWFLSDYHGKKVVEHGGAIDGMRAAVAMIPEEKLGVVILTNMNGSLLPLPLTYKVFDAYLGGPHKDWSGDMLKALKPLEEQGKAAEKRAESQRVMGTRPSLTPESYAGTYKNDLYGEVKIINEGGKLSVAFGPAFKSELEHWHYDTFRANFAGAVASKVFVTFSLSPQGKADTVTLGMVSDYPFKRVAEPPVAKAAQ